MTVEEIFAKINSHMIEGVMLHDQLAAYYDFLSLHGFKRCHEYHALKEFAERRGFVRYYINHYNRLLPEPEAKDPKAIPTGWHAYARQQVDGGTKQKAIKAGFERWKAWETETKEMYEKAYCELCDLGEIAAACKVKELVKAVDMELKGVDRKILELESVDYDLVAIYLCQDTEHEAYKAKEKEIGVNIC